MTPLRRWPPEEIYAEGQPPTFLPARRLQAVAIQACQPFTVLRPDDRDALLTEAAKLCAFLAPRATYDVILNRETST